MRFIFIFLVLSSFWGNAQHVSLKKDSILSQNDTIHYTITNHVLSNLYIKITPKDSLTNAMVFPKKTVLKKEEVVKSFMKIPKSIIDSTAKVNLKHFFDFKIGYGDPKLVRHNDNYKYLLPYKKKRKLIQGNGGKFSHYHKASRYAFDFGTKIGEPIFAAREGIVILTKEDSKKYGRSRKFINDGNFVIILHDDGTTASYYHLHYNGALVEKGDRVTRGQKIGISGMTGFTTIPHLHFVVHTTTEDNGNTSVPITFEGYEGVKLRQGRRYKRKK